jgi:hypothetical protein
MVTEISINKAPALASAFVGQSSFSQKLLNFSITLAQNAQNNQPTSFAESQGASQSGTISISGARARCRIAGAGAPAGNSADIAIYGLSPSLMNQLSTLGIVQDSISQNTIIVSAGTASDLDASAANALSSPLSGFPVVFGGTTYFAFSDYNQMPDVPLRITAQGGLFNAVQSVNPASYTGSTSIVSIFQNFANQLSLPFENNGVTGTISNPYYPGNLLQQIYQAAEHANINANIVDGGTKLAIWPAGGSRTTQTNITLISPQTGMIGYPTFSPNGFMAVKMLFNPDVLFGSNIQVQSSIPQANKTWTVYKLDLALDTLIPDGDWMGTALCYPQGLAAPAPASPVGS